MFAFIAILADPRLFLISTIFSIIVGKLYYKGFLEAITPSFFLRGEGFFYPSALFFTALLSSFYVFIRCKIHNLDGSVRVNQIKAKKKEYIELPFFMGISFGMFINFLLGLLSLI